MLQKCAWLLNMLKICRMPHSPMIWMVVMSGQLTASAVQLLEDILAFTRIIDLVCSRLSI